MSLISFAELNELFAKGKPQIIVFEGPQGVGKTTITNLVREKLLHTELMRLTGCKSDDINMIASVYYNIQTMLDLMAKSNVDLNFVFDRTFLSEWCYRRLGYKGDKTSFEQHGINLVYKLTNLQEKFDVTFVNLQADFPTFGLRLGRNKPQYNNVAFDVENSLAQQAEYTNLFRSIENAYKEMYMPDAFKIINYDTSSPQPVEEKVLEILNMVYNIHHERSEY